MIARLLITIFTYIVNATTSGSNNRFTKAAALPPRPVSGTEFVIGREILDSADTSANPTLGDWVVQRFRDCLQHILAVGRTGSGKTSLLTVIADALVRAGYTFIVIDPRGDLKDRLLKRFAQFADAEHWRTRLTLLDLPSTTWTVPFNVFASGGDPYSIAWSLFNAIEERVSGGLGVQVSEAVRACLLTLAFGRGKWTLLHIEPLLTNAVFRTVVLSDPVCSDPFVTGFWIRYEAMSREQQAGLTGAVMNKFTPWLSIPQFRRMVGQKECLPVRKLIDTKGHVMVVTLGVSELPGAASVLGSMACNAIIQAAMSRATDTVEGDRNPVILLCEEFANYSTPMFHEPLQEGRRMEFGVIMFQQTLSQVRTATSDLSLNNCKTQFYFGTGARDSAQLAREIGGDEAWDARTMLMRQNVGEAYLLRRGEPTKRVKIEYTPDPEIAPATIEAITEASFRTFAKAVSEVDKAIEADFATIRAMAVDSPKAAATRPHDEAGNDSDTQSVEVRPAQSGNRRRRQKED